MGCHLLKFSLGPIRKPSGTLKHRGDLLGILEIVTAVGSIYAPQIEIPAPLAWRLPVTFNLSSLTFIAEVE
jgi:hypothetical protein